ncbi:MAG: universal stress protein family protein [Desulfobacterales bacterium CG23_combo_of_CG06-09_8_20_14_all_52_9]|nr:MAG: universal stress protein family protein [Desulfobacterales bacterium CG23_combo_of_CG06-09_8_20_14_all_52_9]
MSKKLLFVTKFDQLWFDALQSLLDLRQAGLAHIVLLNVIEREKVALHRGTGYRKDEEVKLREMANIRFIEWAEHLFEIGLEVGAYITVGNLVHQVITTCEKEKVDLIVIGRPRQGMLEQIFSGSDVVEIIRRSKTPVLVYKYLHQEPQQAERPFERPLLAMDWSPASQRSVLYLKELKGIISEIHVMHVIEEKSLKSLSGMTVQKARKESRSRLEEVCEQFEKDGIPAVLHVYAGKPVEEIEKAARECQSTLIVVGSSTQAFWKERFIGSIPEALAVKSIFPTLLIPPAD